jgi:hypothetical protein
VTALFPVLLAPSFLFAQDYPCVNKIIPNGETSAQLEVQCGKATVKQKSRTEEILVTVGKETQSQSKTTEEEWFYNLGPSNFIRVFTLQNGKVSAQRTAGYGIDPEQTNSIPCSDQPINAGESVLEVMNKCGKPSGIRQRDDVKEQQIDANRVRRTAATIEDWTFNSGEGRLPRTVTFEYGKVISFRDGGPASTESRGRGSR